MDDFKQYLTSIIPLADNEVDTFTVLFSETKMKKEEYFAVEGEYSSKLGFLLNGVVRAFYRDSNGKEYNKTFFSGQGFLGAYSSLVSGEKNKIYLQCLTDCSFLTAEFPEVKKLYDLNPRFERLARLLAEQFFVIKEKREIELVMLEAAERYEIFRKEHPNLENLIPQYHIASYLGITPTQLSRIRAKK